MRAGECGECGQVSAGWYRWDAADVLVEVRVMPRSSHESISVTGDCLSVRVNTPPVDGKANARVCKLLADAFQVPKSKVTVARGARGRSKTVRIAGPEAIPAL